MVELSMLSSLGWDANIFLYQLGVSVFLHNSRCSDVRCRCPPGGCEVHQIRLDNRCIQFSTFIPLLVSPTSSNPSLFSLSVSVSIRSISLYKISSLASTSIRTSNAQRGASTRRSKILQDASRGTTTLLRSWIRTSRWG